MGIAAQVIFIVRTRNYEIMATFVYPTAAEINLIAQDKLPVLTLQDPIFKHFPIREVNTSIVMWEQMDNYTGLQQVRGIDGKPQRVKKTGAERFTMTPGVYGEFETLDELELTERRPLGTLPGGVIDVTDLVMMAQDKLLSRRIDRIRWIAWTLVTTGVFSVPLATGGIGHTDRYTLQTFAGSSWSTPATATPLQDFRGVKLLARGHGIRLGSGATAYMNQVTFNKLTSNTNQADLFGKRTAGLATVIGVDEINKVLLLEDMPSIVIYDEGYLNDFGIFVPFIADNTTVVIGTRIDGAAIGGYQMTRNANNPNFEPGAYMKVVDDPNDVPRNIAVHDGHNGGPIISYPSAVVLMTTS